MMRRFLQTWLFHPLISLTLLAYLMIDYNVGFSIFLFLSALAHLYQSYYRSLKISKTKGRGVLITGCDTGFGHQLALKLHELQFTVFACCLDDQSDGGKKLNSLGKESGRLHVIKLDVTNQEQVDLAFKYVQDHLPELGLWGLVNNAGLANVMYIEWLSIEEHQKMGSVNLYGLIRMTKIFLPLIRQSRGRIVNVTSLVGRIVFPFLGSYSATKYGVEAISDALRLEMKQFGVKVCIVEPGNYMAATGILSGEEGLRKNVRQLWDKQNDYVRRDYDETSQKWMLSFTESFIGRTGKNISPVVNAMIDALHQLNPKDRYFIASLMDKILAYGYQVVPTFVSDYMMYLFI